MLGSTRESLPLRSSQPARYSPLPLIPGDFEATMSNGLACLADLSVVALAKSEAFGEGWVSRDANSNKIAEEEVDTPAEECECTECEESCICMSVQAATSGAQSYAPDDGLTILGIDPGFATTGYAVLRKYKGQTSLLDYGALTLSREAALSERIHEFYEVVNNKIARWHVNIIALETPFLGKNAQNFLKLGYLRGILHLLAHQHGTLLREFAPREIKMAVTGYGAADKQQVARVITRLFQGLEMPKKLDITDALAISLCALWRETPSYAAQAVL